MRELRCASAPPHREVERFHQCRRKLACILLQTPPQRVEVAPNDGQQIVEVMSDAAGELANRFKLLRLPERVFGLMPELRLGFQPLDIV